LEQIVHAEEIEVGIRCDDPKFFNNLGGIKVEAFAPFCDRMIDFSRFISNIG
jgi:hypothetical protein